MRALSSACRSHLIASRGCLAHRPRRRALALLLFFPLFLLALVAVLSGLEDRTVRQYNPSMNSRRWRDGS